MATQFDTRRGAGGTGSPPRPFIGVVADDITGSGDIGIMFAKHGYAVRIFSADTDLESLPAHLAGERTDVVIIDTDSRMDDPAEAYTKVRHATRTLARLGCQLYWKKTCSVFRGNVGREFDGLLDELNESFGVAVAAFPKNGRSTRGGIHYVHDKPLAESQFRNDPVHPMTESDLVRLLQGQTGRRVGLIPLEVVHRGSAALIEALTQARDDAGVQYAICDGETQADLSVIADAVARQRVLLGSSALAEELPRYWSAPSPFDPLEDVDLGRSGGVLVMAGSVMPQTQAQVSALQETGAKVLTLDSRAALIEPDAEADRLSACAAAALNRGEQVVVRSDNRPEGVDAARQLGATLGMNPVVVSKRISSILARTAEAVLGTTGVRRLIILGGDTSAAICRQLGITEMLVLEEIEPGLPSTLVPGDRPLLLVLKSGSFGGPDFLMRSIAHLRHLGGV